MNNDILHLDKEPLVDVSERVQLVNVITVRDSLCYHEDSLV